MKLLSLLTISLFFIAANGTPVIITASFFNKHYSCKHPYKLKQSTIIILDEDIVIDDECTLFKRTKSFDKNDLLIFYSNKKKSVRVSRSSVWKLPKFNHSSQQIIFMGNAQLVTKPGAIILLQGGELRFANKSRWKVIPELPNTIT